MKSFFKTNSLVITFFLFTFLFGAKLFAQGNLQFNQVIAQGGTYTVPAGKVFKVESVSTSNAFSSECFVALGSLQYIVRYTNESTVAAGGANYLGAITIGGANGVALVYSWPFPIWLKAGDVISTGCSSFTFSGIEFNIVP